MWLSIGCILQQISRSYSSCITDTLYTLISDSLFSLLAAPDNHHSTLCFSEFGYLIYLIHIYSCSVYPYVIGLFYIIRSRFIQNLFSEGLWVELLHSILEVSIIFGTGLLIFLQLDNCNLFCEDPKRAAMTAVIGILWAVCNWSHLTAWPWVVSPRGLEKAVQILEWVSSHSTGYDCLEYCDTECGL